MFQRICASLTVLLFLFGLATPIAADEGTDETNFVGLINDLRTSQGLAELRIDPELNQLARSWTVSLATTGELSHSPDLAVGLSQNWTKLGENVGVSPEGQIERLFEAFVNSPSHFGNLVDPGYDSIGVAVVYRDGQMWTTHRFMALDTANSAGLDGDSVQRYAGSRAPDTAVLSSILRNLSRL